MSTSRLSLFGVSISVFRTNKSLSLIPSLLFPKRLPSISVQFHRSAFSAVTDISTENDRETLDSCPYHPWPEWVTFVDRLKTKGYFIEPPATNEREDVTNDATSDPEGVYKDMNLLKDACLSFARDRYDVFKSLSMKDIQTVVDRGCPNLFRKSVNSAKRLRAHVGLDEGDVCSVCNLRGSCDRAYVILKESEGPARTVDIVRTLLSYALDPLVISGGEKPPGRELVDASARKLLSELVELSETSPDPAFSRPSAKAPPQKERPVHFKDDGQSQNFEMERRVWMCPKCNFMNFARNVRCLECKEDGPQRVRADEIELKKGDWNCPECNYMNFSRNIRCLKCKAKGPKRVGVDDVEMRKGDWNCSVCGFMNFSSNRNCLRCKEARPKRQLNPGEWECPSCDFVNFRRNVVCLRCNCERPKEVTTEYEEQKWRRPLKT